MADNKRLDDIASIQNFPCGRKSQNILRKNLLDTDNPSSTITQTREENSLHSFVSKAFGTVSSLKSHDSTGHTVSSSIKRTTRGEIQQIERIKSKGDVIEDFQPESVLTFCNHLGVSRYDIHKAISDNLKSALEYEIEKVDLTKSKEFLLDLLKSSFQFINVSDLKSVFVTVVKKLGDETPVEVLELLASISTKHPNELKYSDLFNAFSLDVKRLVWEADWDASVRPDGLPVDKPLSQLAEPSKFATLEKGDRLLIDMVKPSIEAYLNHEPLKNDANLAYTSSIRDKRVDTESRRMPTSKTTKDTFGSAATSSGMLTSLSSKLSTLAKIDKSGDKQSLGAYNADDHKSNVPYLVLSALKEIMGTRPKLLAAVLNILIAEHGKNVDVKKLNAEINLVNGAESLHCTLVSDILLFNGQLPKYYEDVRLLAQTLDKCVQIGIISDQAIRQIQDLLRSIFQPDREKDQQPTTQKEKLQSSGNTSVDNPDEVTVKNNVERQFELKLLRKIIKASAMAMKECDPQGLFLNPVTDEIAPGYSSVIRKMMCIRIIEEKAVQLKYDSLDQYESDVQLMFQNCMKYNVGKDGAWFRGEARRQQKKWKEEILTQARDIYREEMNKRKKQLDNAAASSATASAKVLEENKKNAILEQQRKILMGAKEVAKKRKFDREFNDESSTGDNVSAKLIRPLEESSAKKRKKDSFCPSLPALASMLLSDPFVVRLLFDKVLRAIRSDVLKEKTVPADHGTIPSVLQLIHIASLSPKVCAMRGSVFVVPDIGLMSKSTTSEGNDGALLSQSFFLLRNQLPRLGGLILTADMDRRIIAGDLSILSPLPKTKEEEWQFNRLSNRILLDLIQGSLIHLIQMGVSNDNVLVTQCSRFIVAMNALIRGRGNMNNERCFFISLIHSLLRYKAKLPHTVRDMIVKAWLEWIKAGGHGNGITMTSAVHSCFVMLLNQWVSLGNLILPVDTMIMWSEEAIHACELNNDDKSMTFSKYWTMDDENFRQVKFEYEKMLKAMPEDRALKWKESVGILSSNN